MNWVKWNRLNGLTIFRQEVRLTVKRLELIVFIFLVFVYLYRFNWTRQPQKLFKKKIPKYFMNWTGSISIECTIVHGKFWKITRTKWTFDCASLQLNGTISNDVLHIRDKTQLLPLQNFFFTLNNRIDGGKPQIIVVNSFQANIFILHVCVESSNHNRARM